MNLKIYQDVIWSGNPEIDALLAKKAWLKAARPKQLLDLNRDAYGYLILAGRGYGKSLVGSHTARDIAFDNPGIRICVVGATAEAARDINFEGESGLLNVIPESCIVTANRRPLEIKLWNGSMIRGLSADEPERLRGIQSGVTLCDELAAWSYMEAAYTQLTMSTRLPTKFKTKMLILTTPKPLPLIYKLISDERYIKVFGTTFENLENLDPEAVEQMITSTDPRFLRQELYGEMISASETQVFREEWFKIYTKVDNQGKNDLPKFSLVVQAWDTAYTKNTANDPCAVTTWGVFIDYESNSHSVMLIDTWQAHLDYPSLKSAVQREYATGKGPRQNIFTTVTLVEGGSSASGAILVQDCDSLGIPLIPVQTGGKDKVQRASFVSSLPEQGKVYIPCDPENPTKIAPWAQEWMTEMIRFSSDPAAMKTQSDNLVDSTVYAWRYILDSGFTRGQVDWFRESKQLIQKHTERKNPYIF